MTGQGRRLVFLHSSDELYGADRMLLEMVDAAIAGGRGGSVEVWLPTDLPHPPVELSLCHALARRGVTTRHLALPIMRRAYRTPAGLAGLTARARTLYRQLRSARPDILYCTTSAAFLGAPVARAARVPKVVGHIQEIWSRADAMVLAPGARCCHTLLGISPAVAEPLPPRLRRRLQVVPNGVPRPPRASSLEGRDGELRFLVASRWNGWKGHETLLRAWEAAAAPGILVVLGGPPASGNGVDVASLVDTLSRPVAVELVGEVEDPAAYLDQADVVVVPSDQPEPFGLVAIEAFAHGRPVIASAGGGLLDIVSPGRDGWLFPPGNVRALANLLRGLDRHVVTTAGGEARLTYDARYTSERFAATWSACVLTP